MTARMGTGLVIARKRDGGWSAPSAIASGGVGWGFQIGGEVRGDGGHPGLKNAYGFPRALGGFEPSLRRFLILGMGWTIEARRARG